MTRNDRSPWPTGVSRDLPYPQDGVPGRLRPGAPRSVSVLYSAGDVPPGLAEAFARATAAAEDYLRATGDAGLPHTHRMAENRAPGR